MLELVGVFVLLLVQVNEVVCDALLAARLHVPADLERVAGDVADLDVLRNGELLHLGDAAVLGFASCTVNKQWARLSPSNRIITYSKAFLKCHIISMF